MRISLNANHRTLISCWQARKICHGPTPGWRIPTWQPYDAPAPPEVTRRFRFERSRQSSLELLRLRLALLVGVCGASQPRQCRSRTQPRPTLAALANTHGRSLGTTLNHAGMASHGEGRPEGHTGYPVRRSGGRGNVTISSIEHEGPADVLSSLAGVGRRILRILMIASRGRTTKG